MHAYVWAFELEIALNATTLPPFCSTLCDSAILRCLATANHFIGRDTNKQQQQEQRTVLTITKTLCQRLAATQRELARMSAMNFSQRQVHNEQSNRNGKLCTWNFVPLLWPAKRWRHESWADERMLTLCYVGRKLMSALILAGITMQLPLIFPYFITLLLLLLLLLCSLTHTYIHTILTYEYVCTYIYICNVFLKYLHKYYLIFISVKIR